MHYHYAIPASWEDWTIAVMGWEGREKLVEFRGPRCRICRINKDTEEKSQERADEAHCLKTQDTVVHGENHEPIDSRRIP